MLLWLDNWSRVDNFKWMDVPLKKILKIDMTAILTENVSNYH